MSLILNEGRASNRRRVSPLLCMTDSFTATGSVQVRNRKIIAVLGRKFSSKMNSLKILNVRHSKPKFDVRR